MLPSRVYISASKICCLLIALVSTALNAADFSTTIKTASLEKHKDWYQLNAEVVYNLSPTAIEAIQSSLVLVWILNIKLTENRPIWDKTIFHKKYRYKIRYHALLSSYSISDENSSRYFNSLTTALADLSHLRNLNIINSVDIKKNSTYHVAIHLKFDKEALPLPLRALAYLDSNWDLSSDWYLWTLPP
jgi:hypothetical protein